MKKVMAILCLVSLVFALAACGTPSPEPIVEQFCEAMKTYDLAGMNACLAHPREDIGEISEDFMDIPESILNYIKESAGNITYTVNEAEVDGEKAAVAVDFTYNDAYEVMTEALGQYMLALLGAAFSGDTSDDAMLTMFATAFDKALESVEAKTAKTTIVFECVMKDREWFIADMPKDIEYVLTSNAIKPLEDLDDWVEGEDGGEQDYNWTDVPAGKEIQLSSSKITVLECSEENTIKGSWGSATADEGTKFVVFKLKVENTAKDTLEFSALPLYDSQDRHYEGYEDAYWLLEDVFYYTELAPNMPQTGFCVYNVPQDCDGYYLAVAEEGTTDAFRLLGK